MSCQNLLNANKTKKRGRCYHLPRMKWVFATQKFAPKICLPGMDEFGEFAKTITIIYSAPVWENKI